MPKNVVQHQSILKNKIAPTNLNANEESSHDIEHLQKQFDECMTKFEDLDAFMLHRADKSQTKHKANMDIM